MADKVPVVGCFDWFSLWFGNAGRSLACLWQRGVPVKWLVLILFFVLAKPTAAFDEDFLDFPALTLPEPIGLDLEEQLDEAHEAWSERVKGLGIRIDRFFGGEEFEPDPTSYIRVRTIGLLQESKSRAEVRVRARLALPNTEKRFSLILESEDDQRFDRGSGREPSPPGLLRSSRDDSASFMAGLRYLRDISDSVNLDTAIGLHLRRGMPDPYVRVRIGKSFYPGSWEVRPLEEIYWKYHKGQGARSQLLLQRPLSNLLFFRSVSEVDWVYRERRTYVGQDLILTREISSLHAVQAHVGVRGESEPMRVVNWFVNVGWRRNIYKKWLFLELRPELLFDRDESFRAEPRLFLTLEGFFGGFSHDQVVH